MHFLTALCLIHSSYIAYSRVVWQRSYPQLDHIKDHEFRSAACGEIMAEGLINRSNWLQVHMCLFLYLTCSGTVKKSLALVHLVTLTKQQPRSLQQQHRQPGRGSW